MVDAVVSILLDKLLNTLQEETRTINQFRKQFEKLQSELQLMQCFLKDADKKKRKNDTLRGVMSHLRELIYEAEDILADCQLQSSQSSTEGQFPMSWLGCFISKVHFKYQAGKRLEDINEKIGGIKQSIMSYLGPSVVNGIPMTDVDRVPGWSSPVYDHTLVVGLEDDKKMMKDWLFQADGGILEIGVTGMGGLGKTTIAQIVFNDREVENWFERRMWVSVSQTPNEEQIMRSMLRNLGDASMGDDLGELLRKINQYLQNKRYLIVFDDVWKPDGWWHRISQGLPKGNGSSIIITTRNGEVAQKMGVTEGRMHRPKFLSPSDSWLLFGKIAFAANGGMCTNPDLETKGKEIVEKCKGLPLAIKAIGGLLLYKPHYHDWRRIANNFRDELTDNDDSVMASLQLSYDELPAYLKSCFLSFSIYPEDCVITKEQLIHWWIGEGFVPQRAGRSSIEAGESCFSGLTNRCLVEVVDKTYNDAIYSCKIHDMVRDLVINMAEDDAFFQTSGKGCRHLPISDDISSENLKTNRKLRAVMSTTKTGEVNRIASGVADKFHECRYLRVLDICKSVFEMPLSNLLHQIGSLNHLAYLSLSNTHPLVQLPPALEKLKNLQILDVSYCQNLKSLPSYLMCFKKLKILDVGHCGSLEYLPKDLGRLSNLEVLLGFRPARSSEAGCRISELRNLTRLRKLGIHLTREDEIGTDDMNALVNLQDLQFLAISCFDCHKAGLADKIGKLLPPINLEEVCLRFYPGKISPVWLNPISLPMLQYLSITSGNIATMHDAFLGEKNAVWKIEGLMFETLSDLKMEWTIVQQVMPSLRTVTASWCPDLVSFPVENIGFRGGVWVKRA